jgi:uncharacterized membrane protein
MFYLFDSGFSIVLLIILFIVAFVKISNLKLRVTILESRLSSKKDGVEVVPNNSESPIIVNNTAPIIQEVDYGPDTGDKFITWVKDDWMLKLGGLLLLIGLGWFTTYAFMNNWIGEFGRITLGILAGVAVLGLGTWRIKKYINQGGIFLVVGSAIILLTVFAAREYYNMFTPGIALVLMFLSTAYVALVSVKYNAFAVSLSGLVLAFICPLLTNSTTVNEIGLFSYLFVVTLGTIWIVAIKNNWGALIFGSLVGVFLYSLPMFSSSNNNQNDTLLWFAYAFAAVFFLASIINIINSKEADIKSFLWTAVGNGAFLLAWIMAVVSTEWQSLVIAIWMVVFAAGSFIAFGATKIKSVFYVYAGVAVAMLIVATTIELSGAALIVAYTLESFLIPVLIYYATKDVRASTVGSFLIVLPTIMSIGNLDSYYRSSDVLTKDFFVVLLIIVILLALGLMYRKIKGDGEAKTGFHLDNLFLIAGSVYAYFLLWSIFHVGIVSAVTSVTVSLVVITIIGLIKYFYGISVGSKILRNYGGLLIGFVILRLLFIDIWDMEIGPRVIVFILIGVLLMSTAFISRRIKSGFVENTNQNI